MRGVGVSISTESTGLFPWKMGTEVTGLQGGPGGHRALVWGVCTQAFLTLTAPPQRGGLGPWLGLQRKEYKSDNEGDFSAK